MKINRIIHLITGLGGGGAEQMALKLAREAENNNISSLVISISSIDEIKDKFDEYGIQYKFLNIDSFQDLRKGLNKLHDILKEYPPDIIHCHMFHAFMVGTLYSVFYERQPIVFTLHNNKVNQFYRRLLLLLTKPFRHTDIVFSKDGFKWYLKNETIIANGLDIGNFELRNERVPKRDGEIFNFLFLGSLTEQKNPLFLITLVKDLLYRKANAFKINVVGDGPLRDDLVGAINREGLQHYFELHGFSKNIPEFLKNNDCLIMPSKWEGMPVVILEAGASKLPIIATPVGSIPDVLDKETGYLTNLGHFGNEMFNVMQNYNKALLKGEKFYAETLNKYSISQIYMEHLKLYNKAIKYE
jgi:glycosyltransferase involved in cell wall biosynthesis